MGMDVSSGPVFFSKKKGRLAADVSSGLIFLKKKKNKHLALSLPSYWPRQVTYNVSMLLFPHLSNGDDDRHLPHRVVVRTDWVNTHKELKIGPSAWQVLWKHQLLLFLSYSPYSIGMILWKYESDRITPLFETFQHLLQDKIQSFPTRSYASWPPVPLPFVFCSSLMELTFPGTQRPFLPQGLFTYCFLCLEHTFSREPHGWLPHFIQTVPSPRGHLWLSYLKLNPIFSISFFCFIFLPSTYHYIMYLFISFTVCLFQVDCKRHECRTFWSVHWYILNTRIMLGT